MDNITIFGHMDGDLHRTVQFLQERNVNVVIRDERDLNIIRIREAKEEKNAKAISKEKEKATPSGKGKGNACSRAHTNNVISKAALAQRARREREKNEKTRLSYQLGQRLRRERERSRECIQPRQNSLTPCRRSRIDLEQGTKPIEDTPSTKKQTVVTHPSTSLAPLRNRPTPTTPFLQEMRNVGVVIREPNFNNIHICRANEKEKANAMSKGKENVAFSDKGKENARPVEHNNNVISKATLAQRARREREKSGEFIQPRQPALTPSRRGRACLEQGAMTTEDMQSAQKRTNVTHPFTCSFSMANTSLAPQENWIGFKNLWNSKG